MDHGPFSARLISYWWKKLNTSQLKSAGGALTARDYGRMASHSRTYRWSPLGVPQYLSLRPRLLRTQAVHARLATAQRTCLGVTCVLALDVDVVTTPIHRSSSSSSPQPKLLHITPVMSSSTSTATARLNQITNQLGVTASPRDKLLEKHPDDVSPAHTCPSCMPP